MQYDELFDRIIIEHSWFLRLWFVDNSILTDFFQLCSSFLNILQIIILYLEKQGVFVTIHYMNLVSSAFNMIADGSKKIELRLNDEKRQRINIGDTVIFKCLGSEDVITAQVLRLYKFADFEELYKALPLEKCGYTVAEIDTAHYTDMEEYYTKEQIKKYGALGIELCNVSTTGDIEK